ncbi:glycine cleavage system regulatory protein [Sinobacterium caligoides]|uniref:Glycine cleavage system transcriptional repressor n=1 Tax=Sinobacterium caligoides TaxID=933926 RepID=A0A3N2DMI1_9GAMM|nr:ACT domain-containing protein [Sinobacterium caligoides]ROS00990.1 glycine cleavage system regulatory protein [Sinobacterium caligoides]
MREQLVFTFVGNDKPGLVEQLSTTVVDGGGNWEASHLAHMAGKFAGIVKVSADKGAIDALCSELQALEPLGFNITIERTTHVEGSPETYHRDLSILGNDRPGIVLEISKALAARQINIGEFSSHITSAPMAGIPLFEAMLDIAIPSDIALDELNDCLEEIANNLDLEINIENQ